MAGRQCPGCVFCARKGVRQGAPGAGTGERRRKYQKRLTDPYDDEACAEKRVKRLLMLCLFSDPFPLRDQLIPDQTEFIRLNGLQRFAAGHGLRIFHNAFTYF